MSGDRLFKPSEKGRRSPTTNQQRNGDIVNPVRYPEMGGFTPGKRAIKKNGLKIVPTGK